MKDRIATLALLLALTAPAAADDSMSPHRMLGADGQADMNKCAVCHTETLDLARPKNEVCTLCHSETQHAGSYEHLHAESAAVAGAMQLQDGTAAKLPLTESGAIYCGTCHLFHDPALSTEKPLSSGRVGAGTAFSTAVRQSLLSHAAAAAERRGIAGTVAEFPASGTTALRLPVDDGTLCRTCHESYAR